MSLRDDASVALALLEAKGRLRAHRVVDSGPSGVVNLDGLLVHSFSSNDYLGLADHPLLQEAAIGVMRSYGVGAAASRLIMTHRIHEDLEHELAAWLGAERVQLFNSGYAANVGLLSTIASAGDVIFSDELNHASIIDGCRLSRARTVVYRHSDLTDLGTKLSRETGHRRFVVSESVFSMDGDVADLAALRELASQHDSALILDEAHAVGVRGPAGRGVAAEVGVEPDVLIGTLGKAFGCCGAFVAASKEVAEWLWNRARPLVFSTGLPPMISGAARAALGIIAGPEGTLLRQAVAENVGRLEKALGRRSGSHIIPWIVGEDGAAVDWSRRLLSRGLFVQAIRPPTVPEGTARLRIALGTQSAVAMGSLVDEMKEILRAGPPVFHVEP
jgi:8-amino-7-oxononanoate synthase